MVRAHWKNTLNKLPIQHRTALLNEQDVYKRQEKTWRVFQLNVTKFKVHLKLLTNFKLKPSKHYYKHVVLSKPNTVYFEEMCYVTYY